MSTVFDFHAQFTEELDLLERLRLHGAERAASGARVGESPGSQAPTGSDPVDEDDPDLNMDRAFTWMLYETILSRAFRAFEVLTEHAFISYLSGEPDASGRAVGSYLAPIDRTHGRKVLLLNAGTYLDWADPAKVRERANVYLYPENPVYGTYASFAQALHWVRKLRNHVAHESVESAVQYRAVVGDLLMTTPLDFPSVGQLLLMRPTRGAAARREVLAYLLEQLRNAGVALAGAPSPSRSSGS